MQNQNFTRKKVKSQTLGEKLYHLRNESGMTVEELSKKINVKVPYVIALEKGQYDKLPLRVYAKGFVRSYVRFFGASEKAYLNLFDREYTIYQNINHKEDEEEINKLPKISKFVFTPRIMAVTIALVLLSAIGMYLYFSIDNFVSSPFLVINTPLNNSVVTSNTVEVKGATRANSRVFINDQQVFVDMEGNFSDTVDLVGGTNVIAVKSINKFDKESVQELVIEAQYDEPEEKPITNVHIIVKAGDKDVWINVIADGVDVYNDTLESKKEKTFDASEKIVINTSSGSNTMVSVDGGNNFEPLSDEDEMVRDKVFVGEKEAKEIIEQSSTGGE